MPEIISQGNDNTFRGNNNISPNLSYFESNNNNNDSEVNIWHNNITNFNSSPKYGYYHPYLNGKPQHLHHSHTNNNHGNIIHNNFGVNHNNYINNNNNQDNYYRGIHYGPQYTNQSPYMNYPNQYNSSGNNNTFPCHYH